jgi:hypothetical protein
VHLPPLSSASRRFAPGLVPFVAKRERERQADAPTGSREAWG